MRPRVDDAHVPVVPGQEVGRFRRQRSDSPVLMVVVGAINPEEQDAQAQG